MPRRAGRPECGKRAASVNRERNGSIATQQTTSARQANRFRVINATRDVALAESSKKAADPLSRGIGLIGRKGLPAGGGLIIQPCKSVTSFCMRFPIDVLFVDGEGKVCHLMHHMVPWRNSKIVRASKYVVELPSGTLERTGTQLGDRIELEPA